MKRKLLYLLVILTMIILSLPAAMPVGLTVATATALSAPGAEWSKTFGGPGHEAGYSVRQTSDGGYIIAGETSSYGAGGYDVWLIKTDSNGNEQWNKTFGGANNDYGYSVQQTSDGGYIIAGETSSYGAGGSDVWLIKTDSNGNEQWNKTFGGTNNDQGRSVKQTSDGGYIIGGETSSYGAGGSDVWQIKTDSNGNQQWQKTFGGKYDDHGYSVQQTSDGGYVIAGSIQFYEAGSSDVWLIKTDSNGNEQWNKIFSGPSDDHGYSVQQTSDHGYIIAGYTALPGDAGRPDVWLIKTDSNGNQQWNKTFSGLYKAWGRSVQQTSDGGYIIAGMTRSSAGMTFYPFLVKTDSNGDMQWSRTLSSWAAFRSVQQTSDGGYIIAGYQTSYAPEDYVWLVKLKAEPAEYTLTMAVNGSGSTTPAVGGHTYRAGTVVNITATPEPYWQFDNWTGDVANPNSATTTVTMDADKTVTANFSQAVTYTLTMAVNGDGSTTPPVGNHTYPSGTVVNITATPDAGWKFINWEGDVADPNSANTTVTMDADKTVIAVFRVSTVEVNEGNTIYLTPGGSQSDIPLDIKGIPDLGPGDGVGGFTFDLSWDKNVIHVDTVTVAAIGGFAMLAGTPNNVTGKVTVSGFSLGTVYLTDNVTVATLEITAVGNEGATTSIDVAITSLCDKNVVPINAGPINAPVQLSAPPTYTLTIAANGSGSTDPAAGTHSYAAGTVVNISATPASGWQFVNWTGDVAMIADANTATTTITMNGNYTITANFKPIVIPGDANGDGVVNALDITKVERIIAGLDASTPGADANQDGQINALDITKVERLIAGLE